MGRSGRGQISSVIIKIAWINSGNYKNLSHTVGVFAVTRTKHLHNTSQNGYRCGTREVSVSLQKLEGIIPCRGHHIFLSHFSTILIQCPTTRYYRFLQILWRSSSKSPFFSTPQPALLTPYPQSLRYSSVGASQFVNC